jgi:hypothetical protein
MGEIPGQLIITCPSEFQRELKHKIRIKFMLHFLYCYSEIVQLNLKISGTTENQQCYYHSPGPSKGDLVERSK